LIDFVKQGSQPLGRLSYKLANEQLISSTLSHEEKFNTKVSRWHQSNSDSKVRLSISSQRYAAIVMAKLVTEVKPIDSQELEENCKKNFQHPILPFLPSPPPLQSQACRGRRPWSQAAPRPPPARPPPFPSPPPASSPPPPSC